MIEPAAPPNWAAPAILGALLAVLGYLGKLATDFILEWRKANRERRARLVQLLAMLRAGDVAMKIQCEIRNELADRIYARRPELGQLGLGYDRLFSRAFEDMRPEERRLHGLIRAYTVHTMKPLNDGILDWLRTDTHFRGISPRDHRFGRLSAYLQELEAHLLLWRAKYEDWIPDNPDRCLVYLADEDRHGVGFPRGGTKLIADLLGHDLPPGKPDDEGTRGGWRGSLA